MRVITLLRPERDTSLGVEAVSLPQLLSEADVVTLHCPLTPDNRGFMNRDAFALMKPGALLINTARGALINEKELAVALSEAGLGCAAFHFLPVKPATPVHSYFSP